MKKRIFWFGMSVTALALGLVFVGCASKPTVYDPSVPLEQSCTITIGTGVVSFDGVPPKPAWPVGKKLIIPAGSHTFVLRDFREIQTGYQQFTTYRSPDIPITYEFLPGHDYMIAMPFDQRSRTFTAKITDNTELDRELNRELTPDPLSPDASPLEGKWVHTKFEGEQLIIAGDQYIALQKGKYKVRGFISLDGQNVSLSPSATYKKDKWVIINGVRTLELVYDGTLLTTTGAMTGYGYKKAE